MDKKIIEAIEKKLSGVDLSNTDAKTIGEIIYSQLKKKYTRKEVVQFINEYYNIKSGNANLYKYIGKYYLENKLEGFLDKNEDGLNKDIENKEIEKQNIDNKDNKINEEKIDMQDKELINEEDLEILNSLGNTLSNIHDSLSKDDEEEIKEEEIKEEESKISEKVEQEDEDEETEDISLKKDIADADEKTNEDTVEDTVSEVDVENILQKQDKLQEDIDEEINYQERTLDTDKEQSDKEQSQQDISDIISTPENTNNKDKKKFDISNIIEIIKSDKRYLIGGALIILAFIFLGVSYFNKSSVNAPETTLSAENNVQKQKKLEVQVNNNIKQEQNNTKVVQLSDNKKKLEDIINTSIEQLKQQGIEAKPIEYKGSIFLPMELFLYNYAVVPSSAKSKQAVKNVVLKIMKNSEDIKGDYAIWFKLKPIVYDEGLIETCKANHPDLDCTDIKSLRKNKFIIQEYLTLRSKMLGYYKNMGIVLFADNNYVLLNNKDNTITTLNNIILNHINPLFNIMSAKDTAILKAYLDNKQGIINTNLYAYPKGILKVYYGNIVKIISRLKKSGKLGQDPIYSKAFDWLLYYSYLVYKTYAFSK